MPLFSVVIPLYNKKSHVAKCIESVLSQSFDNYELIVIENGSTDGSDEVLAHYNDSRLRVYPFKDNVGVSNARNKGVEIASAPYVTFLDADDWWEPTFLEEMAGLIKRHPDAGIYGTSYWIVKGSQRKLAPIGVKADFTEGEINYCKAYAQTLCMPLTSITVAMPKKVFDETGGFNPQLSLGEDFDLWIRIALKHKVVFLNKPLCNYNQDVNNAAHSVFHLHAPKHHFLWNLGPLEHLEQTNPDYKQLIDNMRCYNLQKYLLDRRFRNDARTELAKVDWLRQPSSIRRLYRLPLWLLRLRSNLLATGAKIKKNIR